MTSSPQAKPFDWTNLRLRILSAVILVPLALAAVWVGEALFLVLTAVAVALLSIEWALMAAPDQPTPAAGVMTVAVLAPMFAAYYGEGAWAWLALPVAAGAAAAASAWALAKAPFDVGAGVLYIGAPSLALIELRSAPDGRGWVLLLMAIAWAADIAAFAAGNALKGPKLWPRISPNKTWSGFVAGLVAAVLAGCAVSAGLRAEGAPPVWLGLAVGLVAGLATMGGDLWESMVKRRFGVKDSGNLIPGHGGLLDRVDGLMFATLAIAIVHALAHRTELVIGGRVA